LRFLLSYSVHDHIIYRDRDEQQPARVPQIMVEADREIKYRAQDRVGEYIRLCPEAFGVVHGNYGVKHGDRHEDKPCRVPYIPEEAHHEIESDRQNGIGERVPVKFRFRFAAHNFICSSP